MASSVLIFWVCVVLGGDEQFGQGRIIPVIGAGRIVLTSQILRAQLASAAGVQVTRLGQLPSKSAWW